MRINTWAIVAVLLCGPLAACSEKDDQGESRPITAPQSTTETASAPVRDACTLISHTQLEKTVGYELREGEPGDAGPGTSRCSFETPAGMYVTRTFDDPPLPEASGFESVVITTYPSTPESFARFRQGLAINAEDVAGIGDDAHFYGPAMIYVRSGGHGMSIRLHVNEPETDEGRARLRGVMLELAEAGVAGL
jgi:hypothetical protein